MDFIIYDKDGNQLNIIHSSSEFVEKYCKDKGYTYEVYPEPADVSAQIAELKEELSSTDYKVIKCSEAQLVGDELPYDIAALHAERQAIRDRINALEGGNN